MNRIPNHVTLAGRTLGGFLLQGQVGSGGMGVVYRARDERLKRTVAIKVLHPKFIADDAVRERFIREGRTAASIDHPNVVRVIAAGEEDGFPYLVMEYVEGGTLDMMLQREAPLSVARCLRIGKQLAEALASAHRAGVMHRDVKPANVLFTNDGEPKLADFGLAREDSGDHRMSQTGILMGTPQYMSPEACEGRHGDARSDIYSLGVVLFAMLEKKLPFSGDSSARIMIAQIQAPVPELTQAPPALKNVIYKALAKNPADRWASASEFAAALERALEEIYLPAAPGSEQPSKCSGLTTLRLKPYSPSADSIGAGMAVEMLPRMGRRRSGRRRILVGVSCVGVFLIAAGMLAATRRSSRTGGTDFPAREAAVAPPSILAVPEAVPDLPSSDPEPVYVAKLPVAPIAVPDPPDIKPREEPAIQSRWGPDAGLEVMRACFVSRDPAGLLAEIDAAAAGASADDRVRIESARDTVLRFDRMLGIAFAWYRSHRGTPVDVQLVHGAVLRGILQAVNETERRISVENATTTAHLRIAELSATELAARVLEGNPDDDTLLAALDFLLLDGKACEAWPVAIRARRRGLVIEPDREALLKSQIPAAKLLAAEADLGALALLKDDPARIRDASRAWLRSYGSLPIAVATGGARESMLCGGGVASAEDLALYCAARVSGRGNSSSLRYDSPEEFLSDFESSGRAFVAPGKFAGLRTGDGTSVRLLHGLAWKEGVIEMQCQAASKFAVLLGWRGPDEHFEIVFAPVSDNRVSVTLPSPEIGFETDLLAGGWIDVRVAWAPGKLTVTSNGISRDCLLPRFWTGEIGFAPGGPWSWRSLQVFGQAEFKPRVSKPPAVPSIRVRRDLKASWGAWSNPPSARDELSIGARSVFAWAAPSMWEAGSDYRATFRMVVSEGASLAVDLGSGDGRRRIVLGAGAASGFVTGPNFVRSGSAPEVPTGRDVAVGIVVHRDLATIELDGKTSWSGHLNSSSRGGMAVGAMGGVVTFKDLELKELEP